MDRLDGGASAGVHVDARPGAVIFCVLGGEVADEVPALLLAR